MAKNKAMSCHHCYLEMFTNKDPEMILAYADDLNTVGNSTIKTKEIFMNIEKKTKKKYRQDRIG